MRLALAVLALLAAGRPSFGQDRAPDGQPLLFAMVNQDGHLVGGFGATGATYFGAARYEVTFDRDVSGCAYVATTPSTYSQAIMVFTAGGHLSGHGVYVETKNQGGGLTPGPFHLVVACGEERTAYAVVGYEGQLVRATAATFLAPLGPGRFAVQFAAPVAGCAFLATVGDPAHDLAYMPRFIATGNGTDNRTVYVETRDLWGGLQDGVPFHLAVLCAQAPGTRVAVVRSEGLIKRGSHLTSAFRVSSGRLAVVTDVPVTTCATVATRGSADGEPPGPPATIEIVPGPAPNAAGFETRSILSMGGTLQEFAFHAAIVCNEPYAQRANPAAPLR
jgi:hypothetical protein